MKVIMNPFNVPEQKEEKIVSVNQEIYKQIRRKMATIMTEYNEKKGKENEKEKEKENEN